MKNSKMRVPAVQQQPAPPTTASLPEEHHDEADELERFIYRASHDLRGPLSRLIGLCNVAALEVSDVQALSYLYRIAYAAGEMDEMLHKVLKVELVKQKELNKAPVSLPKIVVETINAVLKEEGQPQLTYEIIASPALIYTDAFLLELAIENLVRNAVQYRITSARVVPLITVSSKEEGDRLVLTITDNGTGILPEHQSRLFEMFFRGSELSKGPGLGLYITRLCMKRLGGSVRLVESRPHFTAFELQIPMGLWG